MKCPCKECISYAICNAKLKAMEEPDVVKLSVRVKCNSLMDYIYVPTMHTIRKTRVLFNLPPTKGILK
jgi:hypothetical protein